jgi:hypothetical protein
MWSCSTTITSTRAEAGIRALERYRNAAPAERAATGLLSSYATTIFIARGLNYIRERKRNLPSTRSVVRRTYSLRRTGGTRVHHFIPGIAIAFTTGAIAVIKRSEGSELRYSVPFGAGAALTLDELALLVEAKNPYWRSERFALSQAAVAAAGAAAVGVRVGVSPRTAS